MWLKSRIELLLIQDKEGQTLRLETSVNNVW